MQKTITPIDNTLYVSGYIETSTNNNLSRSNLSYFALSEFKNFIFFGYGAGAFEYLFNIRYENLSYYYTIHAHSDLAEFLGEFGLIGTIIVFISILSFFINRNAYSLINIILMCYMIIILFFDFSLHIPLIQVLLITFFIINKKKVN